MRVIIGISTWMLFPFYHRLAVGIVIWIANGVKTTRQYANKCSRLYKRSKDVRNSLSWTQSCVSKRTQPTNTSGIATDVRSSHPLLDKRTSLWILDRLTDDMGSGDWIPTPHQEDFYSSTADRRLSGPSSIAIDVAKEEKK
ncbi:hypothetical protein B0O80DRAFT_285526 [Mortierella sp. GBAus27b]|nr:hypothetical protein B0O80DRAFT_285526 [Mortierella sp. GBAus27b]